MNCQPATRDGRGLYQGYVPYEPKPRKRVDSGNDISRDFLEANYYLAKEFYPELDKHVFQNYWLKEFQFFAGQGIAGQLQLNFPEISIHDLIEKYRDLTRRLKGSGEDVEGIRNYYTDFFTPEMLQSAHPEIPDWVTLIVENTNAGDNNDPTLFGLGLPYGHERENGESNDESEHGTMCYESQRIIRELELTTPDLEFRPGSARTRIIQSMLFMKSRLDRKENRLSTDKSRIKFWSIQLLLSDRTADGWVPYIFMDGGGGACLGRDGGSGNSVYGFCIQAQRKANKI